MLNILEKQKYARSKHCSRDAMVKIRTMPT